MFFSNATNLQNKFLICLLKKYVQVDPHSSKLIVQGFTALSQRPNQTVILLPSDVEQFSSKYTCDNWVYKVCALLPPSSHFLP